MYSFTLNTFLILYLYCYASEIKYFTDQCIKKRSIFVKVISIWQHTYGISNHIYKLLLFELTIVGGGGRPPFISKIRGGELISGIHNLHEWIEG